MNSWKMAILAQKTLHRCITREKIMKIADFIDFQSIAAALVRDPLLPHLCISFCDPNGNILAGDLPEGVCEKFHRQNAYTKVKCFESDLQLAEKHQKGEAYALYTCHNSLTDASAPIVVEGEVIGYLKIGQVFLSPPDLSFFEAQADETGFDKDAYLAAINDVPVVEELKLREMIRYYSSLASMTGTLALQAYQYKLLSDKLAKRTEQLEYVTSELEAFTYSASHDLRAPLRHITGYIDLFNKKYRDQLTGQGAHYFDSIYDSAKQMGRLIDDLLQFSRNGRIDLMRQEADMNAIVDECLKAIKQEDKANDVDWHIGNLPKAYGDRSMLKLVWYNLMDNAVKFTRHTSNARIEIGSNIQEEGPVYYIRDNGVGFDMRYADKLFGVFQRMHSVEQFEGTGIGLATVKRIIARHGGRIWAHAEENKGAAFYFTLPGKVEEI
jgi:signal transduction histidine kinase